MWEDPIVAEVHRIRAKMAAECNYDIDAFFDGVRKRQAAREAKLVSPKRAESDEVAQEHSESTNSAPAPAA